MNLTTDFLLYKVYYKCLIQKSTFKRNKNHFRRKIAKSRPKTNINHLFFRHTLFQALEQSSKEVFSYSASANHRLGGYYNKILSLNVLSKP